MKSLPVALLALALASLPLTLGCWRCEGGPEWERYAGSSTNVNIAAATPTTIPLRISAPTGGVPTDSIAVEIGTDDCAAGTFDLDARLLLADGTVIPTRDGLRLTSSTPSGLRCRDKSVVFEVPTSALSCSTSRCAATLSVELTSATGVGPRQIEARLVQNICDSRDRHDGSIDGWGG